MALSPEVKKALLGAAEAQLMVAVDQVEEVVKVVAAESDNTIDDLFVTGYGMFKAELKKLVDKLDGEVG